MNAHVRILSFGASDAGKKRANNEDACLVDDAIGLYAVADGIGGSEGGEVASRLAVETLASAVPGMLAGLPRGFSEGKNELVMLRSALESANRRIREERSRHPELAGMGTTLTALFVRERRACLIHIGDSRAYLFRSGKLRQISVDHSLVAEYVRAGRLTPEQARISTYRHIITRALGTEDDIAPDAAAEDLRQGDIFLLCTDGLTEMVDDKRIAEILAANGPRKAVQELIDAANREGGVDNITAVVAQVTSI
ncbi:MAG TPA: Stp1/IreP family PP2C-type Ser/Thr phosphatase [Nitrospirota bacterium]